ncbi:MAG: efflux RND transporter periplasmic adaptor subunit [Nitrospirae bacterium]|nr:efflux RND transporter periplasmic adaptor subunit [Nitrospirota bacterium]
MKIIKIQKNKISLILVLAVLMGLFAYVAVTSGPFASVAVLLTEAEIKSLSPALYGVGTVESKYTYEIGPTFTGRLNYLNVNVGDKVKKGQVIGEIDSVDLDDRIVAQEAALQSSIARLKEASERREYAYKQSLRYKKLFDIKAESEETALTKQFDLEVAEAALSAARQDVSRMRSEIKALAAKRADHKLISPVDGFVTARDVDPGSTAVSGQAVVKVIEENSIWINARFEQLGSHGLTKGLSAEITLRSAINAPQPGHVYRVEPLADAVTEEVAAKVIFNKLPYPLPPLGELVEVTIKLPQPAPCLTIPNASLHRVDGKLGVWRVIDSDLHFIPVSIGISDLAGRVQILDGLKAGDKIVEYSEKALNKKRRVRVVERLRSVQQ